VEEMFLAERVQGIYEGATRSTRSRKMIAPETSCVTQGIRDILTQNHIEILNVVVGKSGILDVTDVIAQVLVHQLEAPKRNVTVINIGHHAKPTIRAS
jgi:hypothetical protein